MFSKRSNLGQPGSESFVLKNILSSVGLLVNALLEALDSDRHHYTSKKSIFMCGCCQYPSATDLDFDEQSHSPNNYR